MDSIGAEVGQKMRSAIKAKLMELNCYVDDELPDYIMVMVANKRTKSQMNEDLNLFLNTKTATFVDWLHIVLKKLKEVTVTNPDVYKKSGKRKSSETQENNVKVKKEKKDKKSKKDEQVGSHDNNIDQPKSLTDDLPISAVKLAEQRKIIIMNEQRLHSVSNLVSDGFDIPLLSEVNQSNEQELQDIENKIKSVKSRLGLLVESDEEDQDCLDIKTEHDELFSNKEKEDLKLQKVPTRIVQMQPEETLKDVTKSPETETPLDKSPEKRAKEHKRITFTDNESIKKPSVMDRLGKRRSSDSSTEVKPRKSRINLSQFRKDEEELSRHSREIRKRSNDEKNWKSKAREESRRSRRSAREKKSPESILSRLGVMSKVSIPQREPEEPEHEFKTREVPSMIKVKPRVIPPDAPQANKNLLLKAVAEAQRSIAQTPKVGYNSKPDALYTKKYKEKSLEDRISSRKLPEAEKNKLKNLISHVTSSTDKLSTDGNNDEYIPKPVKKIPQETPNYVPSSRYSDDLENGVIKQQFIITLDGIETSKFKELEKKLEEIKKPSIKSRLDGRKTPSPIIFDKVATTAGSVAKAKPNIPDKLPIVHPPLSIKNKERCKYWPNCRQGDKCEFVHPVTNCEMFPHCKFGDKCLYLHPTCKFGSSCTKRDCPYNHIFSQKANGPRVNASSVPLKLAAQTLQTCKFFPNCTNLNCPFLHPKSCKFGKYCKNQSDCNFSHTPNKSSLTWRSK